MSWQRFFDQISEKPQQRAGGFIFRMEDAAEARRRRRPTTETPRLDVVKARLDVLAKLIERDEREEHER